MRNFNVKLNHTIENTYYGKKEPSEFLLLKITDENLSNTPILPRRGETLFGVQITIIGKLSLSPNLIERG